MKATFFLKPIEWKIEALGEQWGQGETIKGTVTITNHSAESFPLTSPIIALCSGDYKKIEAKNEHAFELLGENSLGGEKSLASKSSADFTFEFALDKNSQISDKKSGLFLGVGQGKIESHIELVIKPLPLFIYFIELLDRFHRFKVKEYKNAKKGVEYKLVPPPSREYASLENLLVTLSLDGDNTLVAMFTAKLKKLELTTISTTIGTEKKEIVIKLNPKEYTMGRDHFDQDKILAAISKATDEVKLKKIY